MLRFARLAAVAALALGGLLALEPAPLPAGAGIVAQPVLDVSTPDGSSSFSATDTSALTPSLVKLQAPTSLNVLGVLHVFGVNETGNLIDLEADSSQAWHSSDITNLIHGATLNGAVSAISPSDGQVSIFGIGTGYAPGHLIQYITSPLTGNLWAATDLSASLGSEKILNPAPSITRDASGLYRIYATSSDGHLIEFADSQRGGWSVLDLTRSSSLPTFVGTAAVTSCPQGTARLTCAFGRDSSGNLLEYFRTVSGVWKAKNLGAALGATGLAGDPSATTIGSLVVTAAARADGRLQVTVSTDGTFPAKTGVFRASTAFDVVGGADLNPPALVAVPAGLLVSMRTQNGHLFNQTLYGLTAFTRGQGTDVTQQLPGGRTVSSRISAVSLNGTVHLAASANLATPVRNDVLAWNTSLTRGQQLTSPNGIFQARLQSDGNFGLFAFGSSLIWSPMFTNPGADFVKVNSAGNLVFKTSSGRTLRSFGYATGRGTSLVLYNNGLLALVSPAGDVLWSVGGDLGNRIIQRARTKLGVGETPDGSNCNPFTAFFSGRGYNDGCAPGTMAEAWCSDFADWVWFNEGAAVDGISGWSYTFVDYGTRHGTLKLGPLNNPQVGDAVVWGSTAEKYGQHVGLITDVRFGYIRVLSGNSGTDNVSESGWIDASSSTISGYGIVGYITPVPGRVGAARTSAPTRTISSVTQTMIDTQDGGH